jgi:HlyD family secretion protein
MTAAPTKSPFWKIGIVVAVVLVIAAIVGVSRREDAVVVTVAKAEYRDLKQQVTTNGTVIPTSEFQARANFPGIVEKIDVELGDRVKPGQMLVTMKDPFATSRVATANSALQSARVGDENVRQGGSQEERITLEGDLQHAQETKTQAEKALAALQDLRKRGAASQAEVESAQEKLKAANTTLQTLQQRSTNRYSRGDVRSADARVKDAEENLRSAKIQFANANISSPIRGTVYSIVVSPYDFVPMGGDLLRVANLNAVEVKAFFDEPEIGKLAAGQTVTIVWDGRPGRTWHGHIKQAPVAATALGARSVGECIISVDDAKEDLLPNTNVIVTVMIQEHSHVLTVPRAALRTNGPVSYVYRVIDGRLQRTDVTPGIVSLDRVEIAKGLAENDMVAVSALDNRELSDGIAVKTTTAGNSDSASRRSLMRRILGFSQR